MATVCENVVTITTPGDCVDILVTDYGIAVNPLKIPSEPVITLTLKFVSISSADNTTKSNLFT